MKGTRSAREDHGQVPPAETKETKTQGGGAAGTESRVQMEQNKSYQGRSRVAKRSGVERPPGVPKNQRSKSEAVMGGRIRWARASLGNEGEGEEAKWGNQCVIRYCVEPAWASEGKTHPRKG